MLKNFLFISFLIVNINLFADSSSCSVQEQEESSCNKQLSYDRGQSLYKTDLSEALLVPASIDLCDGINFFAKTSFIYWEPLSNQLDIGFANLDSPNQFRIATTSFDFKPGFKVGLGKNFKYDDWDFYTQYTYLHMKKNSSLDPSSLLGEFYTTWFFLGSTFDFPSITSDIDNTWKVDLDKIDLELARAVYWGSKMIVRPFLGLSGHFLDQSYSLSLTTTANYSVLIKTDSWAIGPRLGFNMNYFLYKKFRLFSNAAINLLYTSIKTKGSGSESTSSYDLDKETKNIIRDVEELSIGFAYGTYTSKKNWYFDLSVSYEIQRYSQTNYMTGYAQGFSVETANNVSTALINPGNFFIHGLTASLQVNF